MEKNSGCGYFSDDELERHDYQKEANVSERGTMFGVYPGIRVPPNP